MLPKRIDTLDDLHIYLYAAMQLEHATIPPYLMALYSIKPGSNPDACQVLRVVVVEEMLHLTLAANVLNAVGGTPDLTVHNFVPRYPAFLPDGEHEFKVGIEPFSEKAVDTFLMIERPKQPRGPLTRRPRRDTTQLMLVSHEEGFHSIGEFYEEVRRGIKALHEEKGDALFSGDPSRQVGSAYYYSGGGDIHEVFDLESAMSAISLIIEQGEGLGGRIFGKGNAHELAHYYRFEQLKLKKYYQEGNRPGHPDGPPVHVDWNAVYRFKPNARIDDYPPGSALRAAAWDFHEAYAGFLASLTRAFNGEPSWLIEAVPEMFKLRRKIERLIHTPIPDKKGVNAAPVFRIEPPPAAASAAA